MIYITHLSRVLVSTTMILLLAVLNAAAYEPPRSALMIDVGNDKVLFEEAADALRHPASLTKMMTVYLVFEALEAGKIKLDTDIVASRHSADRPPSRLGHAKDEVISVDLAIDALVVRSANDVAAAVGELLGGTEDDFARLMTAKARALGMKDTIYKNASGLPDKEQITTARDQAILGLALKTDFPSYFPRFSVPSVSYKDRTWNSHNKLIQKVPTVTGIKTGFINASGFNVVTYSEEATTDRLVVVMGGRSAKERDQIVIDLLEGKKPAHQLEAEKQGRLIALLESQDGERAIPAPEFVVADEIKPTAEEKITEQVELPEAVETKTQPAELTLATAAADKIPPYAIQVGALPSQKRAMERLTLARPAFKQGEDQLRQYMIPLETSRGTVYRARIVGFETMQAAFDACDVMKTKDIECMALIQK